MTKTNNKKAFLLWLIIFLFSLAICFAFAMPHYTHDTFKIINNGYINYTQNYFIKEARPFTALITIIAAIIQLPIEVYSILSFLIAIGLLSYTAVIIYQIIKKVLNTISKRESLLLILISHLFVYSYLAIEHIFFLESCMMALGILLSIIAAKVIIEDKKYKYIKAILIILTAVFCYQGSIAIFPMFLLTYYFLLVPLKGKEKVAFTIKTAFIYGIAMLLTILYCKFLIGESRIHTNIEMVSLKEILWNLKYLVIDSLGVIPSFTHLSIMLLTTITILIFSKNTKKEKCKLVINYFFIYIASVAICMMPVFMGAGLDLIPRMCIAYGTTIAISLLFLWTTVRKEKNRKNRIVQILILTIFIANSILYTTLTIQHLKVNQLDRQLSQKVKQIIEEYEEKENKQITQIVMCFDKNSQKYYDGFIHAGPYTKRATGSWATREALMYYMQRNFRFAPITYQECAMLFKEKDWDEFSEEQIILKDNILYFCVY